MKTRIKIIIFLSLLALTAMGCSVSFTTAKIDSLNFGKNDKANPPTTSFNVGEQVFVIANVTGAMGKNKLKIKMTPTGGSAVEKDVDFEGSKPITYSFTPSSPVEIKFDVSLLDDSGKEVDKKSGTITVKGSAPAPTDAKKDEDSDHSSDDKSHD
ncbi:MAG: hypothetical protein K1X72_17875 [Pyrinomonadaceae bacterium]|nr:hypothetical protein [Pyrinomonadaceae bacterium]